MKSCIFHRLSSHSLHLIICCNWHIYPSVDFPWSTTKERVPSNRFAPLGVQLSPSAPFSFSTDVCSNFLDFEVDRHRPIYSRSGVTKYRIRLSTVRVPLLPCMLKVKVCIFILNSRMAWRTTEWRPFAYVDELQPLLLEIRQKSHANFFRETREITPEANRIGHRATEPCCCKSTDALSHFQDHVKTVLTKMNSELFCWFINDVATDQRRGKGGVKGENLGPQMTG